MRFAFSVADWLIRESLRKTRAPPFACYLIEKAATQHEKKKANAKHIVIKWG